VADDDLLDLVEILRIPVEIHPRQGVVLVVDIGLHLDLKVDMGGIRHL
jgi:hypothetical protein